MSSKVCIRLVGWVVLAGLPGLWTGRGLAQQAAPQLHERRNEPVVPKKAVAATEEAPAQTVLDAQEGIAFDLPGGWLLSRVDREVSTFHLDARTAPRTALMRSVATIASNPFPESSFSGALLYLSVTPHSRPEACAAQATMAPNKQVSPAVIADVAFHRGHDEHGFMCIEARDEVYTAMRDNVCIRFDLAINTFCAGSQNGAKEMTPEQIGDIETRMQGILATVRFVKR